MDDSRTLALMTKEVARILNVESIDPDIGVGELGVDSLNVMELILVCDQLYGVEIDPERLHIDQFTTLRDLDRQLLDMRLSARNDEAPAEASTAADTSGQRKTSIA
jgi:acyl carrier protein